LRQGNGAEGDWFRPLRLITSALLFVFLLTVVALSATTGMASNNLPKYIDEYAVPTSNSAPLAITVGKNGMVWFTESNATKLGTFDPTNKTFKEYSVPGVGDMWGVTVDQSGYVWLTQYSGKGSVNPGGAIVPGGHGHLLRFNPVSGNFTSIDIPTEGSFPFRLIADDAGRIWFTELLGNKIGVYDPLSNRLEEYNVPSYFAGPADLTFDRHGNLWFTEAYNESVAEFQPLTKTFVEYHLSTTDPSRFVASPVGIAIAQDGEVWFADHGGNWIVQFNPASKALTRYPTSAPSGYSYGVAIPNGLLIDGHGRIWFCEHWGNRIGYFDPGTQTMVEFPIPTGPISTALWIAQAPNGDIWLTEWSANNIGVLPANPSVPFSVGVSKDNLSLAAGENTGLSLLTNTTPKVAGNGTFTYSWSSYNPSEVGVAFSPDPYPSLAGPTGKTSEAEIKASSSVSPGNYTLAIGIDAGAVRVSSMVQIQVTQKGRSIAFPGTTVVLYLAPLLAVAVGVLLLRRKFREAAKGRQSTQSNVI